MSCDLITFTSTCHIFITTADRVNLSSVPETRENFMWKYFFFFFVPHSILRQSNGLSKLWLGYIVLFLLLICTYFNEVKMVNSCIAIGCTNCAKLGSEISFH